MSDKTPDEGKKLFLQLGATIGGAAAGAVAALASSAATADIRRAEFTNYVTTVMSYLTNPMHTNLGISPATPSWWVPFLIHPATTTITVAIGTGLGAYAGYRLAKKIFI